VERENGFKASQKFKEVMEDTVMEKINLSSIYSNLYNTAYNSKQQAGRRANGTRGEEAAFERSVSAKETEQAAKKDPVELSDKANKLLKDLQKKYGNMNFLVGNYSSEEEAHSILSRHATNKDFSVLIDPETLEKMAADKDVRAKYEGILSDAAGQLTSIKEELGDDEDKVKSLGISIDGEGKVSFFAEMEKASAEQREKLDEKRAAKKEEASKEARHTKEKEQLEKLHNKENTKVLSADSAQELLEKIRLYKFEPRKDDITVGKTFDLSV